MADLTQVAANVAAASTGVGQITGSSGAALVAGNTAYLNNDDGLWYAGKSGNSNASGNFGTAVCLNSAPGVGQPVQLFQSGQINLGATLAVGETYVYSAAQGKICPLSDLGGGNVNFTTIIGVAVNTGFLQTPVAGMFASNIARA